MIGPPIGLVHGHSSHSIESCSSTSGHGHCIRITNAHRRGGRVLAFADVAATNKAAYASFIYIQFNCTTSGSIRYIYYYYICIFQIFIYRTWRFSMSIQARSSIKSPKQLAVIEINTTATAHSCTKKRNRIIKHEA